MRRSEINEAIRFAKEVFSQNRISLPTYAYWSRQDWSKAGHEYDGVRKNELGWTVTDFGSGDFDRIGLTMYDLRNGSYEDPTQGTPYAEKFLVFKAGQRAPLHRHFKKTEDIINRFGGTLCISLYLVGPDNRVDKQTGGTVYCDGIATQFVPGQVIELAPGQSITITPEIYHTLWAREDDGALIGGEVTTICDPHGDNHFPEGGERFMQIEEDAKPLHLLNTEYPPASVREDT